MPLRIDTYGNLDPRSVNELAPNELSAWIAARLQGRDTLVKDDPRQQVGDHYLIAAIYPGLELETQANVRRVVLRFLNEMGGEEETIWRGEAADQLLLLAMAIGDQELAAPIVQMAHSEQFSDDENLYFRLVQCLIYLHEKVTPTFWGDLYEKAPARYAAVALDGLLMHSLYEGLVKLVHVDWQHERVRHCIFPSLRGMLASKGYNRDELRKEILDPSIWSNFSDRGKQAMNEALPELRLAHTNAPPLAPMQDFRRHLEALDKPARLVNLDTWVG